MTPDRRRKVVEYGIPLDLVVIATGATFLTPGQPILHLLLFLAAVVGGAWFGAWKGGASAAAFSIVALLFSASLPLSYYGAFVAASAALTLLIPQLSRRPRPAAAAPPAAPATEQSIAEEIERERERISRDLNERLEAERAEMRRQMELRLAEERARIEREAHEELEREKQAVHEALQRQLDQEREELRRRADEELSSERAALGGDVQPATEPVHVPSPLARPLDFALPLLVLLIYWNVSDLVSRNLGIPSILQPIIVVLGILVWRKREHFSPLTIALQPLTLFLAAYAFVVFASSIWASDLALADDRITETVKNLLIYLLAASLAVSWKALWRALTAIAFAAAAIATVSVAQIVTGELLGELAGFARIKIGNIYGDLSDLRAAGPVGDPNYYGQILVMVLPVAVYIAWAETRKWHRLAWAAAAAAIAAGVLVTYSRGAMLALAMMTAIVMIARRMPIARIASATVAVVLLLVLLPGNVSGRIRTLIPQDEGRPDSSIEKRQLLVMTAVRMFDENPLLGVGAGNFSARFDEYANRVGTIAQISSMPGEVEHAHTLFLEIGAEYGVVGLTAFLAAIAAAFVSAWRAGRRLAALGQWGRSALALGLGIALSGYMATSLFLHTGWDRYMWLLLAFIAAMTRLASSEPSRAMEAAA